MNAGRYNLSGADRIADAIEVNMGAYATLNLNNFNEKIGSLGGAGSVTLGSGYLNTGSNGLNTTFGGTISGTGGFLKEGTGTMTLSHSNTYSGETWINEGTLKLSGWGGN